MPSGWLVLCAIIQSALVGLTVSSEVNAPRVCVIGAGVGGLVTARYLKDENIQFTVLESTKYVGGTWRYEERVGKDEDGLPIHTSMYKHLRTNLPKVLMELKDFPIPKDTPSFPSWEHFYNYLKSYAENFNLYKFIQFQHQATSVKRVGDLWVVKHKHIPTGKEFQEEYDYVVVASGHHSKPHVPTFPGQEHFKGTMIHSHDYRVPDPYKCRKVLVVGAGPSGLDIGLDVADVSKTLIHSHHSNIDNRTPYPKHYINKPNIKEFNETGVVFVDGTYEEIDDVILCTGFEYDYPFLDETSGLTMSRHGVNPLYRHLVNINQPTMVIMGLVVRACIVVAMDAQARYTTALIKGNFTLPTHEVMMSNWKKHLTSQPASNVHLLAHREDEYYADLAKESGIEKVPLVFSKIHAMDTQAIIDNPYSYRNYAYTILDRDNFVATLEKEVTPRNYSCAKIF